MAAGCPGRKTPERDMGSIFGEIGRPLCRARGGDCAQTCDGLTHVSTPEQPRAGRLVLPPRFHGRSAEGRSRA